MEKPAWQKGAEKRKKSAEDKRRSKKQEFENAMANANMGEPPTVQDLIAYLSTDDKEVPQSSVYTWVKRYGYQVDKNTGKVTKKTKSDSGKEDH